MRNKVAWLVCTAFTFSEWNISALADSNPDNYAVMYQSAWRDGIDPRLVIQAPRPISISAIALREFNGVALEASMHQSDDFTHVANGTPRVEVSFTNLAHFAVGNEYLVRWSTMIPPEYQLDSLQPEIITQLHQSGSQGSPPFALMLVS